MDLNVLATSLQSANWNNSEITDNAGITFDLVMKKTLMGNPVSVLIKQTSMFDINIAMAWHNRIQLLNKEYKARSGFFRGQAYYLCLIAEIAMADAIFAIQHDTFGIIMKFNNPGCMGVLIADEENRVVHEKKLSLPAINIYAKAYTQLSETLLHSL